MSEALNVSSFHAKALYTWIPLSVCKFDYRTLSGRLPTFSSFSIHVKHSPEPPGSWSRNRCVRGGCAAAKISLRTDGSP